jgi:hypothetical protein
VWHVEQVEPMCRRGSVLGPWLRSLPFDMMSSLVEALGEFPAYSVGLGSGGVIQTLNLVCILEHVKSVREVACLMISCAFV